MPVAYQTSREHLLDELHRLDLMLNVEVVRQRMDPAHGTFDRFRGLFLSDDEIDAALECSEPPSPMPAKRQAGSELLPERLRQMERQIAEKIAASAAEGVPLGLPILAARFGLPAFDSDALLICVAPELDVKYGKLYAYLQDDVTRKSATADLILKLLCRSFEERLRGRARLSSGGPLLRYGLLVERGAGAEATSAFLGRTLAMQPAILNFLLGCDDLVIGRLVTPRASLDEVLLPPVLIENFASAFLARNRGEVTTILFHGPAGVGKRMFAEALCLASGVPLIEANLSRMISTGFADALHALFREATLHDAAVYLDEAEVLTAPGEAAAGMLTLVDSVLAGFGKTIFLGSERPWEGMDELGGRRLFRIEVPPQSYPLRRRLWPTLLARAGYQILSSTNLDGLADKFAFTPGKIHNAIAEAERLALLRSRGAAVTLEDLQTACRAQCGTGLATLARKIVPQYGWNDIVLPPSEMAQLSEISAHVQHRQQVFASWGFERRFSLGKGLNILFVGESGTGKTMAAEIVAGALGLDLYKIDLSSVVSKYIGETEKNLSRIFQEAEMSNAILFFDEADAIFGKRSEVKDSHDRYSNIEINYLLQRMEEYSGTVILASNFKKNIDEAFTRRMRFVVEFPFPTEEYRLGIWKNVFPHETPLGQDIDLRLLAGKLKVSGGSIRNIALHAAFLAAARRTAVGMEHIMQSTRREFQKMGRLCVKSDFGPYFDLVQGEA
jgi:SpoVK/Ycf46/Vps4 family AAA+-type ATPase